MDEGSQCIANAVGAREGERILDACAGNGGKTLAMAANMGERGEICAFDIDKRRLSHLKANSERARVAALVTTTESLDELASESFDAILVDAPCSSVGALRRTPSLRHSYDDPRELAKVQAEILDGVARLLKPGGRLVYATCSVLSIENQDVAEAFERKHDDFAPWPFEDSVLTSPAVELRSHERLFLPHVHGTDGFYIARFVRRTAD
jgi:16S rRNA (cytosine967-C5)-methyltransferase